MFKRIFSGLSSFVSTLKLLLKHFKSQSAYEVVTFSLCSKMGKSLITIKVLGKSQVFTCYAEEVAVDDDFILRFSPADIRTIVYLATSDKYELIMEEKKLKKSYEIIRSRSIKGEKTARLKNKITGEFIVVSLSACSMSNLIDHLEATDAFHLGYLAGQEQSWKDSMRLKVISSKNDSSNIFS